MDIKDAANVKNEVEMMSVLIVSLIYIALSFATSGFFIIYALITLIISSMILSNEIAVLESRCNINRFKKSMPFSIFGLLHGHYQHVFCHNEVLEEKIANSIIANLREKMPMATFSSLDAIDVDSDLDIEEKRGFLLVQLNKTKRGSIVSLILDSSIFGNMQVISWWVLTGGYVDRDKTFNFVFYAFLTLPFWIIPYIIVKCSKIY